MGRIVVTEGISLPMLTSEIEEMGALGIVATNPGEIGRASCRERV